MFQKLSSSFFGHSLASAGIGRTVQAAQVVEVAQQAIAAFPDPAIATHTQAVSVQGQTLSVTVKHPAVAELIVEQQVELLTAINQKLGKQLIENVRFVQGWMQLTWRFLCYNFI